MSTSCVGGFCLCRSGMHFKDGSCQNGWWPAEQLAALDFNETQRETQAASAAAAAAQDDEEVIQNVMTAVAVAAVSAALISSLGAFAFRAIRSSRASPMEDEAGEAPAMYERLPVA